jgi:hypothetical protein
MLASREKQGKDVNLQRLDVTTVNLDIYYYSGHLFTQNAEKAEF